MPGIVDESTLSEEFRNGWSPTKATVTAVEDVSQSQQLNERVRAVPSQCYWNARRAIMRLKEYAGATYVEGWAYTRHGMTMEHGWVVRDGNLIDPTLPGGCEAYWPGLEFRGRDGIKDFLAAAGSKYRRCPFFYAFGWGGCGSPAFRLAAHQAQAHQMRMPLDVYRAIIVEGRMKWEEWVVSMGRNCSPTT